MKIGIDARLFLNGRFTGIPETAWQVLRRWMRAHREHEYYFISCVDIVLPEELPDNAHRIIEPMKRGGGTLWLLTKLTGIIRRLELDAFWGINYFLPGRVQGCRYLVTCYDLSFRRYPQAASVKNLIALRLLCPGSFRRADAVHVISDSTGRDLAHYYHVPQEKIRRVYLGAPEASAGRDAHADEETPARFSACADRPFFLALSTLEPRKNPVTILKAYEHFRAEGGDAAALIFAGAKGWKTEAFFAALAASPVQEEVLLPGFVSKEEKKWLLSHATALLYPSLYEGFGIPVLEAMEAGCPVITARNSSLPEVGGDAAYYVDDPADAPGIARYMHIIANATDDERKALETRMRQNLARFSWDACAEELLRILTSLP